MSILAVLVVASETYRGAFSVIRSDDYSILTMLKTDGYHRDTHSGMESAPEGRFDHTFYMGFHQSHLTHPDEFL